MLVCTFHEHQPSLLTEFPALKQHPILKKWLYLPETADTFEQDARRLVQLARAADPRLGVAPSPRKETETGKNPRAGEILTELRHRAQLAAEIRQTPLARLVRREMPGQGLVKGGNRTQCPHRGNEIVPEFRRSLVHCRQ
ncbi:MAG: hypothetical protein WDM96_11725 [Lacunisphaera sp.]